MSAIEKLIVEMPEAFKDNTSSAVSSPTHEAKYEISGSKNIPDTDEKLKELKWKILTLPGYSEEDTELSIKLSDFLRKMVARIKVQDCRIEVNDGHAGETEPHYQFEVNSGNFTDLTLAGSLAFAYESIDGSVWEPDKIEKAQGKITISVYLPQTFKGSISSILIDIFGYYDKMMEDYYPSCDIDYDHPEYLFSEDVESYRKMVLNLAKKFPELNDDPAIQRIFSSEAMSLSEYAIVHDLSSAASRRRVNLIEKQGDYSEDDPCIHALVRLASRIRAESSDLALSDDIATFRSQRGSDREPDSYDQFELSQL